jgi:outer membrane protein assembly factor BamB
MYATPIVDGDLVYVATYSGQVLALSTLARSQNLTFPQQRYGEWEWNCPIDNAGSNAIVANLLVSGDTIYVSSSNGRVYSLDKEFGDQNWESKVLDERQRKLWTSPVIEGDALYVSTLDGHIYALSVETGQLLDWSFESQAGFASSPVIYEDTIFLGSFDRRLYAVEIGSNVSLWKFPQDKAAGNWFWAAPIANGGIVYAGCLDGRLYAINATTGKEIWSYTTEDQEGKPSPITSSPVLMGNFLIVANESGNVYAFDLSAEIDDQGMPSKTISIGAGIKSSFCAQEGLAYIRGEDSQLYVVDIDKAKVSWKISLSAEK